MIVAALAFAIVAPVQVRTTVQSDSSDTTKVVRTIVRDSVTGRRRNSTTRLPVTAEVLATAFRDTAARTLLLKARVARLRQDSSLVSYDATAYQRVSVGLGIRATGRDRLFFRTENASRVRWAQGSGVHVDMLGQRAALPMIKDADVKPDDDMAPIPYFPGRESLWIGSGIARAEVDEDEMIHPIATGAEAYYRYSSGDSISFRLPGDRTIILKELRVEPRYPEWKLSVGSFWFDASSGQLVRAAYRFSAVMNIWAVAEEEDDDDVPAAVKLMLSPMEANLEGVTIEYGLYGGRFWLPRTQSATATARVSFMRVPVKIEESFRYASVNGTDSLPPIPAAPMSVRDSLFPNDTTDWSNLPREERRARNRRIAEADSVRREQRRLAREAECATSGTYTQYDRRYDGSVSVATTIPCDSTVLANSPALPPSIYDPGEELFGDAERDALLASLDFGLQAAWAPQTIDLEYGLNLQRYNRVEGLSLSAAAGQELGRGYSWRVQPRIGLADLEPGVDLTIARTNGRQLRELTAYRRLAVANDWGAPLSFGASLGAVLFGRDEGFYYRTLGAELTGRNIRGDGFRWRLFAERQDEAKRETNASLAHAMSDVRFIENIRADEGFYGGAGVRWTRSLGYDPLGWRMLLDGRAEAATGEFDYVRGAFDATVSHGLGERLSAALTGSAGYSGGRLPTQRLWYLGDQYTVRGQRPSPDAPGQVGDAYWLARAELAAEMTGVRPIIFGDLGWAGDRHDFSAPGVPLSGAGVGMSFLDGLIRFDLSRGINPKPRTRFDFYLEARF